MQQRKSWRDYSSRPIEPDKIEILKDSFSKVSPPFGNKPTFAIVDFSGEIKSLLTYGFVKGTNVFIAGKTVPTLLSCIDYGWSLEHIILIATGLDLQTCWLGGTFRTTKFANKLRLQEKEVLPAVAALGYAKRKRSFRDQIIRKLAASHTRKMRQQLFFEQDFNTPLAYQGNEYDLALEMVRLAPSSANHQPWRIIQRQDCFDFYIKKSAQRVKLKRINLQILDLGIAMFHFDQSLKDQNILGHWKVQSEMLPKIPQDIEYVVSWERAI